VITFKLDPNLALLKEFPFPIRLLPLRRTYDWNAMRMAVRLCRYIHQEQVDIVHTFFPSADLWGGMISKLSHHRPILVSSRRDMGFLRTAKHRIAYRALRRMFDQVLTVSEKVREYSILEDGIDPERIQTIPNPVNPEKLKLRESVAELRQRFDLTGASHVITSVGNIRRVKGTDILVRTAALVCRQFPKTVFVVAGALETAEPGYLREVERLKRDHHVVRNVRFVGSVDNVAGLLKASDIFCLLSRTEGFSNALVEAMASALPCVATRVGGNTEVLLDGRCGFLVESEDYKTAADQVCALLRDPDMARGMGELAFQSVRRRFLPEIVTAQLVEVYDRLLNATKRSGVR
jgi:glycosyltransferase involved in cell wall biosynthesis